MSFLSPPMLIYVLLLSLHLSLLMTSPMHPCTIPSKVRTMEVFLPVSEPNYTTLPRLYAEIGQI